MSIVIGTLSTFFLIYAVAITYYVPSRNPDIEIRKISVDISLQNMRIGLGYAAISMAGFISLLFAH